MATQNHGISETNRGEERRLVQAMVPASIHEELAILAIRERVPQKSIIEVAIINELERRRLKKTA